MWDGTSLSLILISSQKAVDLLKLPYTYILNFDCSLYATLCWGKKKNPLKTSDIFLTRKY